MPNVAITREDYLQDKPGRTFADVLNSAKQLVDEVLEFFSDEGRQRRMEEAEIHHDRAPMAGVVRIIMEQRGWKKTGKKGSLGVRAESSAYSPAHNTGGLAFWFVRAERFKLVEGLPNRSVSERCRELQADRP